MRRWRRVRAARVSRGLNMAWVTYLLTYLLLLGAGLASLASDDFLGVLDALALVRLGRAHAPDLRGNLADQLLIGASDDDGVRRLDGEADAGRCRVQHRVRVADLQHEITGG